MKIHDKDPVSGLVPISSPPSPTKRRRPSVKRRQGLEEDNVDEPPTKKVCLVLGAGRSLLDRKS